jgi:hypothetical protein
VAQFLVFARAAFEDPLSHQGEVAAPGPDAARHAALDAYGEDWVELSLIPQDAVRWTLGPSPAEQEEGG